MNNINDKLPVFAAGVLIGGVVGGTFAMLFTPFSGKKLRRKILRTTNYLLDDANEYIESQKTRAEEVLRQSKKKADEIIGDAKKIISN